MKHKFFGIFGKVFFYTVLILLFVITIMFVFFSEQIKGVVESTQRQQISDVFRPLLTQIEKKSDEEIIEIAKGFHEKNTSFEFCFESAGGEILYQTKNFIMPPQVGETQSKNIIIKRVSPKNEQLKIPPGIAANRFQFITLTANGARLYVTGSSSGTAVYREFIEKAVIAFSMVFLFSMLATAVFARRIAKPIQKIAYDTKKMSDLEPVCPPDSRRDEIGHLAGDVYKMYKTLKSTIRQLETEIAREKDMEENQRYFFSAVSHELKTPIAATSALLEGMLENVIEPEQYPEYLHECLKMMNQQNKLVMEILEVVSLSDPAIACKKEEVDLKNFISYILSSYQTIAEANNQSIDMQIPEDLFYPLDTKLFGRALSNIIMNAVQNTPKDKKIRIYTQDSEHGVNLCVFNERAKIPEEILSKLFEPFYREDKTRSCDQGRSGLGLTIVKKALELMEIPFTLSNTEEGVLFRMDLLC